MAKLYFKHGTMKSGKSIDLIKAHKLYEISDRNILVLKPSVDTRSQGEVSSRLGVSINALNVPSNSRGFIINEVEREKPDVILVDEAQFFTKEQIEEFVSVVDDMNIPVVCWGLKVDFAGNLFDGSKALMELADKVEEVKTVCQYCDSKATMNLRGVINDGVMYAAPLDSKTVQIGDNEYIQTCRKHWNLYKNGDKIIPNLNRS